MKKSRGCEKGFTLLELLMVVIIIAILAAIALPQYLRVAEKSRASEAMTLMASIRSSEGRYRSADPGNAYTTDLSALDVDLPGVTPASGDVDVVTQNWTITVNGTTSDSNVVASRNDGSGRAIDLVMESGTLCASDAIYGLPVGPGAGPLADCP